MNCTGRVLQIQYKLNLENSSSTIKKRNKGGKFKSYLVTFFLVFLSFSHFMPVFTKKTDCRSLSVDGFLWN